MIYLLTILLFCFTAFSSEKMELVFSESQIRQGSIAAGLLKVDSSTIQNLDLQKLKGHSLANTLYFYSLSPVMKKDGESKYESEVKVIFMALPKSNAIVATVQGKEIVLILNKIEVLPTEVEKGFKFLDFEVPSPIKIFYWVLAILSTVIVSVLTFVLIQKSKRQTILKNKREKLKLELIEAKDYQSIVEVWMKRKQYKETFSHIEEPFKKFEIVLYKYQFKPVQTEFERNEVLKAYEEFLNSVQGGFNGI